MFDCEYDSMMNHEILQLGLAGPARNVKHVLKCSEQMVPVAT